MAEADETVGPDGIHAVSGIDDGGASAQAAIEYFYDHGWSDGLPAVPCTRRRLGEFLHQTDREPDDILMAMPHLNRACTVREAAVNAVMAGCLPEYFPVVVAAWEALDRLKVGTTAHWQSTTGSAPFLVVNGPIAERIGMNGAGDVFGSGFRPNATIGRAIRLTAMSVFLLRPHHLDQATQGTPAKYACCIAENAAASPWPALHVEHGYDAEESTVAVKLVRGTMHIEARHAATPEQLLTDIGDSMSRTGHLIAAGGSACVVFGPEHARLIAAAGWVKADVKEFLYERSVRSAEHMARVGKGAVSRRTGWYVPVGHADATDGDERRSVHAIRSPEAIDVLVAGADNAGVSTVVEATGSLGKPMTISRVRE